jgi:hypothetical protein
MEQFSSILLYANKSIYARLLKRFTIIKVEIINLYDTLVNMDDI